MEIVNIILLILLAYLILVFVILRLIFPFMGFRISLPLQIPEVIKEKILEFERTSHTPEDYLIQAYEFVTHRWHAGRFVTIMRFPMAFRKDLNDIWNSPGYAHCTTQNYMLFVLLAGSKFFEPEDVKIKTVFFNFFIHQYLSVRLGDDRWMSADPGGAGIRGLPLGAYIRLFG